VVGCDVSLRQININREDLLEIIANSICDIVLKENRGKTILSR
jgi:hypothetical protein